MARLYARRIKSGAMTIDEVPKYWRADTESAYVSMYGEEL